MNSSPWISVRSAFLCFAWTACAVQLDVDRLNADWPGLLGPTRDGHTPSGVLIPTQGVPLKAAWSLPAGQGYAGPAIQNGKCALYERVGNSDLVRLVNSADGQEIWRRELPASYRGGIDPDRGPRSVPTIAGEMVIVYSASGELNALSLAKGTVLWSRPLRKEFQSEDGYFGAGSTPLVVGDRVIVNVGARSAGIVCVSLKDGSTLWKATEAEASYAAPIRIEIQGKDVALVPTRLRTYAVDIASGEVLWNVPFGQRGPTVNAATPIVLGSGNVFLTASYGIGTLSLRPTKAAGEIVAKGEEFYSQYATPIFSRGYLIGSDGREDGPKAVLKCWDAATGKLRWQKENMPVCHLIADGEGHVLVFGIDGQVWVVQDSAERFIPLWEGRLPSGLYRALPAFDGTFLYVKETAGDSSHWLAVPMR